jgi:hypothetical protein
VPTIMRSGPYRVFFYSGDQGEPPHVHVQREGMVAKFWLEPVRLQISGGFGASELRRIEALVRDSAGKLVERWHEFFGA